MTKGFPDLEFLFRPRTIAVMGASERPGSYGVRAIKNLEKIGYQGEIYPVNPKYETVAGYKCYPSVSDIPGDVDAAIMAMAAQFVPPAVGEAVKKGVRNGVVFAASFAETGEEGKKAQQQLVEIASKGGMNLIGPNCLGMINLHDRVAMWGLTHMGGALKPGRIGFVSQSGQTASTLLQTGRGTEFSVVVSLGNRAVLDTPDYINFLVNDPNTDVIMALIETLQDPQRFIQAAENATRVGKPIVVLKTGRSEKGQIITLAHTGSLSGQDDLYNSLFKKYGVSRVYDLDQLIETTKALSVKKRPTGTGLAVVSYSGGECGLVSDLSEDIGVSLPDLADQTKEVLRTTLPDYATVNNPLDVTAGRWGDMDYFSGCLTTLSEDPGIDMIAFVVDYPSQMLESRKSIITNITEAAANVSKATGKLIMHLSTVNSLYPSVMDFMQEKGVISLSGVNTGLLAIKHLFNYSQFLNTLSVRTQLRERVKADREKVATILTATPERVIPELGSKEILKAYGIPVPESHMAISEKEAVGYAGQIGYPLVLKVQATGVHHKTDVGGVVLNVRDEEQLLVGYRSIQQSVTAKCPGAVIEGILVEKMAEVSGGVEVIVGAKYDPQIGSSILFGLGGIFVEVLKDYSTKVVPINKWDAEEMISEIKSKALLQGARGRKKSDINAIVDVLLRVSDLAEDFGDQLAELDINPLVVLEDGKGCMALDAMIVKKAQKSVGAAAAETTTQIV